MILVGVLVGLLLAQKRSSPILQAKVYNVSDNEENVGQKKGTRRNINVSSPMGLKPPSLPPSDLQRPIKDDEFISRLNSKRNSVNSYSSEIVNYPLEDLSTATRNFSVHTVVGKGNVGCVYKAKYPDGKVRINILEIKRIFKLNFLLIIILLSGNNELKTGFLN